LRRETKGGRALAEPTQHGVGLVGGKLGRAAETRGSSKGVATAFAISLDPAANGAWSDAEELGDLGLRVASVDAIHREAPAIFQIESRPCVCHGPYYGSLEALDKWFVKIRNICKTDKMVKDLLGHSFSDDQ